MSWQKRSIQLILGLPLSLPIVAYAINIGDTYVQSQQNQPLNASINVSDIDPATFSVKIADSAAYQQLGLSKDANISVRFQPTSSNGGQIVLTSNKPLNVPFADVVLNVSNKGDTKLLPKTLLMPIDNSQRVITQSNTSLVNVEPNTVTIGATNQVALPVVSEPVPVSTNEPVAARPTNANRPALPVSSNTVGTDGIDPQHLVINEVRRYYPAGEAPPSAAPVASAESAAPLVTNNTAEKPASKAPTTTKATSKPTKAQKSATTATTQTPSVAPANTTKYVVQRNDNLWTIANRIAKKNKTDVDTVMKQIMAANPAAFPDNDPTQMTANTTILIPKYEVRPSQAGIKAANTIRQQTRKTTKARSNASSAKKAATTAKKPVTKPKTTAAAKVTKPKRVVPKPKAVVQTKRKTEMKIIAPSKSNGSVQGTTQTTTKVTGTGSSSQVIAQVQQKRQATAQKATKVNQLNQTLVNAEKRLKVQNAKLAQLEQRLKELNKK